MEWGTLAARVVMRTSWAVFSAGWQATAKRWVTLLECLAWPEAAYLLSGGLAEV